MKILLGITFILALAMGSYLAASEGTEPKSASMENLPGAEEHLHGEMNDGWKVQVNAFHEDNLKRAPGGVVFIGDSITAGFPMDKMLPEQNPANRGIGGDAIWGLLRRLNESAYELKPSKVFVMIGINDIFINKLTVPEYRQLYDCLFRDLRKNCPGAKIYVQSLLPVRGNFANIDSSNLNATIREVNQVLRSIAMEQELTYIDLHPEFCDQNSELNAKWSDDGCHPNRAGYELWVRLLPDLLEKR
jgi:lysophospholipase L1-like esterase